jgi:membrane protease YdiL (CAAX protease family)
VALACAVLAGTPAIEALGRRAIEWSSYPIVRGNGSLFVMVAVFVAATAVATELALRGWLVERVLELSPGPPVLPILVGAFAEALVTPGDVAARLGAAIFGIGLGWMYVASGRSIAAPLAARLVFQLGVLSLEAMRLVG